MHGAVMLDENGAVLRPVADLVRHAHPARVRLAHREDRLRKADRAHLQSGAAQLHPDETAVGQERTAGDLREDPPHPVPQGLCALPPDGRVRHRRAGGLAARCCWTSRTAAGRRKWPRPRDSRELAAQGLRVAGDLRAHQREGRRADRIDRRNTGCRGRGRSGRGRCGHGHSAAGSVSATIGTSGVVFAATAEPTKDPKGRLHTFCHAVPGLWHVMGVTQSAGLSLRWLKETSSPARTTTR